MNKKPSVLEACGFDLDALTILLKIKILTMVDNIFDECHEIQSLIKILSEEFGKILIANMNIIARKKRIISRKECDRILGMLYFARLGHEEDEIGNFIKKFTEVEF